MDPVTETVQANGIYFSVMRWGNAGRPPLLLSHGTGFCGLVWQRVAERLLGSYTVYAFDRRGHGRTEQAADGYDITTLALDVRALIGALDLVDVYAVGHSSGATELLLAAGVGNVFRRIVALEPILGLATGCEDLALAEKARRRSSSFDSKDEAFARWVEVLPFSRWDPDVLRDYVECGVEEIGGGRARLRCLPELEAAAYEGLATLDLVAALERVECPVLVVVGEETERRHKTMAEAVVKALQRVGQTSVTGAGHFLPMEFPVRVAELVWAFGAED